MQKRGAELVKAIAKLESSLSDNSSKGYLYACSRHLEMRIVLISSSTLCVQMKSGDFPAIMGAGYSLSVGRTHVRTES